MFEAYYTIAFLFGLYFNHIQNLIGMKSGWEAIDYYTEVHLSFWNSIIHTFFMPWTMFGIFVWLPAVFVGDKYIVEDVWDSYELRWKQNIVPYDIEMRNTIICFFLGIYLNLSPKITLAVMLWYFLPYSASMWFYRSQTPFYNFVFGFSVMVIALGIQEYFGHYLCGDDTSRIEAIPNAILYAPFYSVSHLA